MATTSAVLFAAGRGVRLRPLSDVVPKAALPLLDVPVGACGLAAFARAGLRPVVNVSHLAEAAKAALDGYAGGIRWFHEPPEPYGTAGTLREARAGGLVEGDVVTWNADVIADVDVAALAERHARTGATATVVVWPVDTGADFTLREGRVERFVDRRLERDVPGARFSGISVLSPAALQLIPEVGPAGLGETVLAGLARRGELAAVEVRLPPVDVGTVTDYLTASRRLLAGELRGLPAPPGRLIGVPGGRAYLGPGASAAPESLRDGAVVLRGARVEEGALITSAVIWPGERLGSGTTAADCVWFRGAPLA